MTRPILPGEMIGEIASRVKIEKATPKGILEANNRILMLSVIDPKHDLSAMFVWAQERFKELERAMDLVVKYNRLPNQDEKPICGFSGEVIDMKGPPQLIDLLTREDSHRICDPEHQYNQDLEDLLRLFPQTIKCVDYRFGGSVRRCPPLFVAVVKGFPIRVVRTLLEHKADPNARVEVTLDKIEEKPMFEVLEAILKEKGWQRNIEEIRTLFQEFGLKSAENK